MKLDRETLADEFLTFINQMIKRNNISTSAEGPAAAL